MTYFITFTCYGCHLHGGNSGSVDLQHNTPGTPTLAEDRVLAAIDRRCMEQLPYILDKTRREAVRDAIVEVCTHRGWRLLAVHVRSNHVHTVVEAEVPPEKVMNDFKTYASRRLNQLGVDAPDRKRWTRHGSTQWLWKPEQISAAVQYVVSEQGAAMSVVESDED